MLKAYVQIDDFAQKLYTALECYQVLSKVPIDTNKLWSRIKVRCSIDTHFPYPGYL